MEANEHHDWWVGTGNFPEISLTEISLSILQLLGTFCPIESPCRCLQSTNLAPDIKLWLAWWIYARPPKSPKLGLICNPDIFWASGDPRPHTIWIFYGALEGKGLLQIWIFFALRPESDQNWLLEVLFSSQNHIVSNKFPFWDTSQARGLILSGYFGWFWAKFHLDILCENPKFSTQASIEVFGGASMLQCHGPGTPWT